MSLATQVRLIDFDARLGGPDCAVCNLGARFLQLQSISHLSFRERWGIFAWRPSRAIGCFAALVMLNACNQSNPSHVESGPSTQSTTQPSENPPPSIEKPAEPLTIIPLPPEPDDPTRWLTASTPRDGAKGGWVEGSFDPARNRIDIHTKDITRFALDTGRLAIDWSKLVVIEVDGKSAELRHRENPMIEFEPDGAGHWKVKE